MVGGIILSFVMLHILTAAIMAVFPRDEGMRNKIGLTSFTTKPKSAGDYIFNGLVFLIAGGAFCMEYINERIEHKYWLVRIGTRIVILSMAVVAAFLLAIIVSIHH